MLEAFYKSDLQGLYALWVVPGLFLAWLLLRAGAEDGGAEPRAARFVRAWAVVFGIETLLDPLATGPMLGWFGVADAPYALAFILPFVLVGDLRVFLLIFFLLSPERGATHATGRAALWTLIVPLFAWTTNRALAAVAGPFPDQSLWLVYELGFTALALYLREQLIPTEAGEGRPAVIGCARSLAAYVAVYYALWAAADVLILAGLDAGWGLRVIPNQLYYSFWVPFAYLRLRS